MIRSVALVLVFGMACSRSGSGTSEFTTQQMWAIGNMQRPKQQGNTVVFQNDRGVARVAFVNENVVRVRYLPNGEKEHLRSFAVVDQKNAPVSPRVTTGSSSTEIQSSALRVIVHHEPFRVEFFDHKGRSLDTDDPSRGVFHVGHQSKVWKRLLPDEHIYGFGEKSGPLDKRGMQLGGASYTMWNSDTPGYDGSTDPLYISVPFFMVMREGRSHGIFLDNTYRTHFDIGKEQPDLLSMSIGGGELDYYFIQGPEPKKVTERYTELTGRMQLPPMWALGFHQCRYSYYPEAKLRAIADNFRKRNIPADTLWLDIHYLQDYKPFTWDTKRFPDPAKLIADLRKQNFRVVSIIDAHPKKEVGYHVYDQGIAGGHFVTNKDGSIYEAPVWPSMAENSPADSVFPDFSSSKTRDWWGSLYKPLLDIGIAGIWNDMNEPAVFNTATGTFALDVQHKNDGRPTDHREIHNVYGMLMTQATHSGLKQLRPEMRPLVLSRASFAGGQRYAAVWPGDNQSSWNALRQSIPMHMGLGLSGFAFVGSDVGGFMGAPTSELFTRWLQSAVFSPFFRAHTTFGTPDQEPWSYGKDHEALNRAAIEMRYRFLPHIYNEMRLASQTGIPALRPLFMEFPLDEQSWRNSELSMFGDSLLLAPVLWPGVNTREVYLPEGTWFDLQSTTTYEGAQTHTLQVTLKSIPIFVREGAFIFTKDQVQFSDALADKALRVDIFPANDSSKEYYEDDALSMAYKAGDYLLRRFSQHRDKEHIDIKIEKIEGEFQPKTRQLILQIHGLQGSPKTVQINGKILDKKNGKSFSVESNGTLTLPLKDSLESKEIKIQL
ncbi:MAG: glycoside hydrolase family 31 protein [Myxococcales bacterium]|nr:MAG: glycoside hydrolase family 31 protein [Myxococcales bacterium]